MADGCCPSPVAQHAANDTNIVEIASQLQYNYNIYELLIIDQLRFRCYSSLLTHPWSKSSPNGDDVLVRLACFPSATTPQFPIHPYRHQRENDNDDEEGRKSREKH